MKFAKEKEQELTVELRKVFNDDEFVLAILCYLRNDDDIDAVLQLIRQDDNITSSDITLFAMIRSGKVELEEDFVDDLIIDDFGIVSKNAILVNEE